MCCHAPFFNDLKAAGFIDHFWKVITFSELLIPAPTSESCPGSDLPQDHGVPMFIIGPYKKGVG
jgi:hypothetical protein